ncbi:pre-mRNA-splicing factor CWC25 homolog isoform X1 [Pygocentrus nattereri]|uniref:pre-mRNA-splicing factor CWC25 homolog isoform X1 n=1 Tax=Pygocentrus nattereri TaxID=42514 RepID=UPI000814971B|nr:pre-mRNA-splicing factor CWC25 homolog isoform X1 [Pygocentrus nattereri]
MGGGDLNLKKSWHPQTLKNIERVWKAEQKHEAERKKIEELQKELKEERAREEITKYAQETGALKRKDERLDWMYQGPAGQISREEYLLGRPVDKQIMDQYEEPESGPSTETGLLPGSIFNPSTSVSSLDMAAKIREDPLFEIRKREEDKKRSILTNPVKMKEIQKMLRHNLEKEKEKKKKRKKDKKEKREEKERKKDKKHKRRSSSSDEEDRKHSRSREENGVVGRSHSHQKSGYGLQLPASRSHHSSDSNHADHHRDRSRSPLRHREDKNNHSSYESDKRSKPKAPSPSPQRDRYRRPQNTNHSKRLSAEELERKRKEMLGFAREREEERESNVKRYKRQDEQERTRDDVRRGNHASFIHNMKLESAASSSVEDRVKRNIHSIQRTSASLEKNFMRR